MNIRSRHCIYLYVIFCVGLCEKKLKSALSFGNDVPLSKMCTICREFKIQFIREHKESGCPFAASLYCSVCAVYGHTMETCANRPKAVYTQPCFMEQLIPPSIQSPLQVAKGTPLTNQEEHINDIIQNHIERTAKTCQGVIRIKKDDKVIRAYLMARSIIGTRVKAKGCRDLLELHAKEQSKRLVSFPDKW
jgi:hypothetical protein